MRISDWSSDVCSSDLCRARTCPFAWSSATAYSRSLAMSVQLNAAACRATSACAKRSRVRGGKELLPERGRGRSHVRPQAPEPQEVRRKQKLTRKIGCGSAQPPCPATKKTPHGFTDGWPARTGNGGWGGRI